MTARRHADGLTRCGPCRSEERRVGKEWGSTSGALVTGVQTCALPIYFQGVHRTAVADEEGGHSCHGKKVASAVDRDKANGGKDREGHECSVAKRWRDLRLTGVFGELCAVIQA